MARLLRICILWCLIIAGIFSCAPSGRSGHSQLTSTVTKTGIDSSLYNLPVKIDSFNIPIIPPSSGIQFYKDGIVFLSLIKNEEKMLAKHISFGTFQAYFAKLDETGLGKPSVFSTDSYFQYPCDAISFCDDYKTMYFTKIQENGNREKIFRAIYAPEVKNPNRWITDKEPLSFCKKTLTYSHPSISADGSFMIFASNDFTSARGMDLFMTRKTGGSWSEPISLGDSINTKGDEFFPFLDIENNLFFSSDGYKTNGDFDIYFCKRKNNKWDKPVNLSKHINSDKDEIAFTIDRKDCKSAFFTTRERTRKGEMQLYRITYNKNNTKDYANITAVLNDMVQKEKLSISNSIIAASRPPEVSEVTRTEPIKPEETKVRIKAEKTDSVKPANLPAENIKIAEIKKEQVTDKPVNPEISSEKRIDPVSNIVKSEIKYKVQLSAGMKSKGAHKILIDGKDYDVSEYFYKGAYRFTIGEFNTLKSATELQNLCRRSGIEQAFVVVFKDNIRSTDPALFK